MEALQIKNFKGINLEEGLWKDGYAKYVLGLDIFGVQDNTTKLSLPGVLQGNKVFLVGTEAAATNNVTDLNGHFALYSNEVWALSVANPGRLYKRATGTWTLQYTTANVTSTAGGGGLAVFNNILWILEDGRIDTWDGAVFTANWNAFTATAGNPRPWKTFAGKLFIGDNRYIASVDSASTFNPTALTLPAEFIIRSMETYADRLYIFADNGQYSRMFIWDGSSSTFQSYFDLRDESTAPYLIFNEGNLWAVAARGVSTPGTPIYIFNGSTFQKILSLPIQVASGYSALATYRGALLIASSNSGNATFEDGVAGIWMVGRYDSNHPYNAVLAYNVANGTTLTSLGGIYSSGNIVYVGTRNHNSGEYEIWEIQGSDTNLNGVWQSLPIDGGDATKTKSWHAIQVDSELPTDSANGSRTIVIKYRLDYANSWVTLKTLASGVATSNLNVPLGRTSKVIEIRFEITSAAGVICTREHGFTLYFTPSTQ